MAHRFYTENLLGLGEIILHQDETNHVLVSRIRPGEKIILFNGDGNDYLGIFKGLLRREAHFKIEKITPNIREKPFPIVIGAPLPKGDREQFLIEKLVELGVSVFVPLETNRSQIHPEPKRLERLRKHVIEASKQCGRSQLMKINNLSSWQKFLSTKKDQEKGWIAHGPNRDGLLNQTINLNNESIFGAVGPEGGLTDMEIDQAKLMGWNVIDLGTLTLRIETAALLLAWEMGRHAQKII